MTIKEFKELNQARRDAYRKTLPDKRAKDKYGNTLSEKGSFNAWYEWTWDKENELTQISWNGFWKRKTYKPDGDELTYEDSDGLYEINYEKVSKERFDLFMKSNKIILKIHKTDEVVNYLLSSEDLNDRKIGSLRWDKTDYWVSGVGNLSTFEEFQNELGKKVLSMNNGIKPFIQKVDIRTGIKGVKNA